MIQKDDNKLQCNSKQVFSCCKIDILPIWAAQYHHNTCVTSQSVHPVTAYRGIKSKGITIKNVRSMMEMGINLANLGYPTSLVPAVTQKSPDGLIPALPRRFRRGRPSGIKNMMRTYVQYDIPQLGLHWGHRPGVLRVKAFCNHRRRHSS
jgi:hypothetical protein